MTVVGRRRTGRGATRPEKRFRSATMQAANHNAGPKARMTRDASLPQESSESTACEDCFVREAAGVDPAGRALCRPCARRFQSLVCDGSGFSEQEIATRLKELRDAIQDIPDADPESLTLHSEGHGHFIIHSDEFEQDVDEIDAALDGTGYERNGIVNPPRKTRQKIAPVEEGDDDD